MNNKKYFISIVFVLLVLSNCIAKEKKDTPYIKGLKSLLDDESFSNQALYNKNYLNYNNQKIDTFGYINKLNSRIYFSSEYEDPIQYDDNEYMESWSLLMFKDYKKNELFVIPNECKTKNSLVEVIGIFRVEKINNGKIYYLTDIESIYDFDTRPINEGGTGKRHLCYSIQQ